MGQTTGDCKVVIKDQHQGLPEQQTTAFHAQLNTLDQSQLLPQSGVKPTDCPSLPPLTINDQQPNTNAIHQNDGASSPGGNAVQSTYEALDRDSTPAGSADQAANSQTIRPEYRNTVSGSAAAGFENCATSVISGPSSSDGDCGQSNRANESIIPDENQNQNMIGARALQPAYSGGALVNMEQPNANALRPGYSAAGNSILSTYESLDRDTKPWKPEAGCPVNPEQPNTNSIVAPDEDQRQSYIFKRLETQPEVFTMKPQ